MSRIIVIVLICLFALGEISAGLNIFKASVKIGQYKSTSQRNSSENKIKLLENLHKIRGGLKQRRTLSSLPKKTIGYDGKVDKSFYILTSS